MHAVCRSLSEEALKQRQLAICDHMLIFERPKVECPVQSLWLNISWLTSQDRKQNCPALEAIWRCLAQQFRDQLPDRDAAKAAFRQGLTGLRESDAQLKYLTDDAINAINNWDEIHTTELGKVILVQSECSCKVLSENINYFAGVTFRFHAYSHMAAAVLKAGLEDGTIQPEELGDRFPLPDQLVELIKARFPTLPGLTYTGFRPIACHVIDLTQQ